MDDARLDGLEHGKKLREENDLISCKAIIQFSSGINWQPWPAVIPPENINSEGEVEVVWLDCKIQEDDINGITHKIIDPRVSTSTTVEAVAWIERFELSASHRSPALYPSSKLEVLYRIIP